MLRAPTFYKKLFFYWVLCESVTTNATLIKIIFYNVVVQQHILRIKICIRMLDQHHASGGEGSATAWCHKLVTRTQTCFATPPGGGSLGGPRFGGVQKHPRGGSPGGGGILNNRYFGGASWSFPIDGFPDLRFSHIPKKGCFLTLFWHVRKRPKLGHPRKLQYLYMFVQTCCTHVWMCRQHCTWHVIILYSERWSCKNIFVYKYFYIIKRPTLYRVAGVITQFFSWMKKCRCENFAERWQPKIFMTHRFIIFFEN